MNSGNFDKVLFVLSTDALSHLMLPQVPEPQLAEIRRLARLEIEAFMAGGENYYMDVDFSAERQANTRNHFFGVLRKLVGDPAIDYAIDSLADNNALSSQGHQNARAKLESIAARLCWLKTEDLIVPVDPLMQDVAVKLTASDIDPRSVNYSLNRDRMDSVEPLSAWDERIFSDAMFDGIEGVAKLAARDMIEGAANVGFLREWRLFLEPDEFSEVCLYLWKEVQAELADGDEFELTAIQEMLTKTHT